MLIMRSCRSCGLEWRGKDVTNDSPCPRCNKKPDAPKEKVTKNNGAYVLTKLEYN